MSTLSVRRPLSVVAVLAMVATMLFAVAGTASAATTPADLADYTACPANAGIPDAGFTDVAPGSTFDDAINCIAYYEVTKGTTATTYSPGADVSREEMALFLTRLAPSAGVSLAASPPSAGFTDITGLSAESQLAINQLADAGIVQGTSATTYSPGLDVSREHMSLFLTRFLDEAIVGPGGTALSGANTTGAPFTDIGDVTFESHVAINQVWHLGVTTGTGDGTTYSPTDSVTREQMAAFLTRLADHMNTRPAGVNIQAKPVSGFGDINSRISVTARTADFLPAATNTPVDIWRFNPTSTVTTPFNTNGTCDFTFGVISIVQGGSTACTLELTDPTVTAAGNGNWPVFTETVPDGTSATFYAWTGAAGTTFDNDTTVHSKVIVESAAGATSATFKADLPKYSEATPDAEPVNDHNVKFGTTVTLTVQLTDGVRPVERAGVSYTFQDRKTVNDIVVATTFTTVRTDATGKATYTVTQSDPNTARGNDDHGANAISVLGAPTGVPSSIVLFWDDDAPEATTVVAGTSTEYKTQSNNASNTATATLYDQYGMTIAGEVINFTSGTTGVTEINEVQTITFEDAATEGTYTLTFGGYTTDPIAHNADAAAVDTELENLDSIGENNVVVSDTGTPAAPGDMVVTFEGALAAANVGDLTADAAELVDGTTITIVETTQGWSPGIGGAAIAKTTNSAGVAMLGYTWNWTDGSITGAETITVTHPSDYDETVFYWVYRATDGLESDAAAVLVADVANDTVVAQVNNAGAFTSWTWQAVDTFRVNGGLVSQAAFERQVAHPTTDPDIVVIAYPLPTGRSEFNVIP